MNKGEELTLDALANWNSLERLNIYKGTLRIEYAERNWNLDRLEEMIFTADRRTDLRFVKELPSLEYVDIAITEALDAAPLFERKGLEMYLQVAREMAEFEDDRYPDNKVIEVYFIGENQTAVKKKHLPITLISMDTFAGYGMESFEKIGVERLDIQALPDLSVSKIAKDKYIRSLEKHVEDTLAQEGKSGTYKMYTGEYESFGQNRVGISAAVVGEEEYYFRYMITKSHADHYYFWPTGFGLNGSLGECEG